MGKGYTLKVILVPHEDVADTLGSGDTALVKDILRDKTKRELFDQVERKRPFTFNIVSPTKKISKTTAVGDPLKKEIKQAEQRDKPFRTVQECVKHLIKPNNIEQNQDETQAEQSSNLVVPHSIDNIDDDGYTERLDDESELVAVASSESPPMSPSKKKKKKKKYIFDDENDDVLDERIGYKYLYALETIISYCPSAKYLEDTHHWVDFRPGFISDVQVHAFKKGIDLDLHTVLERGVPPSWNEKKKFPKVLDYPTVGYLKYTEMADIVMRLVPDDDDDVVEDGVNGDLEDGRHGDERKVHHEAIEEFKGWIDTSIREAKDLVFFIY